MTFRTDLESLCVKDNKENKDASNKLWHPEIDWSKESYVDRVGTMHMLNGKGYVSDCLDKASSGFPRADEVLALSTCVNDKKALAEEYIGQHEALNVLRSLPAKLKEAALNNEKHVVVTTLSSPKVPDNYLGLVNTLREKGYKTGVVHGPSGQEVQEGRPIAGLQVYQLIAKFDK